MEQCDEIYVTGCMTTIVVLLVTLSLGPILLALNALENLVELRDSQMLSYQSNQTAIAKYTDLQ